MAKSETLTLIVEPEMDGEGRRRAVSAFLLLRECPQDVAEYLKPHRSLAQVQAARDALTQQAEVAAAAEIAAAESENKETVEIKKPSEQTLRVAHAVTSLLEHSDMFMVDLDAGTAEAARNDVAHDAAAARAAGENFDADVAQLQSIAERAMTREVIVRGLPELDAVAQPQSALPITDAPAAA